MVNVWEGLEKSIHNEIFKTRDNGLSLVSLLMVDWDLGREEVD